MPPGSSSGRCSAASRPCAPGCLSKRWSTPATPTGSSRGPAGVRSMSVVPDTLPPGPTLPPLVMGALMAAGTTFVERWHRRYGDRFTLRLGRFGTYVYLADPDDIKAVFHGDDTVVHAGEANAPFLGRVLGPSSVLVTDEDVHLRQRRRLSGPFHGSSVARLAPRMAAIAAADVDSWPAGRRFRVIERTRAITLEVILQT